MHFNYATTYGYSYENEIFEQTKLTETIQAAYGQCLWYFENTGADYAMIGEILPDGSLEIIERFEKTERSQLIDKIV
jgi:hypothetical protein